MIGRVVLATDGSTSVSRAIATAIDLAGRFDAELHALYVLDTDEVDAAPATVRDEIRDALQARSDSALDAVSAGTDRGVVTAVRHGRPVVEINAYCREVDADVVAIGTRGRHGEHRLLLGSVAEEVVRTSPIPVLTVRQLEGSAGS